MTLENNNINVFLFECACVYLGGVGVGRIGLIILEWF